MSLESLASTFNRMQGFGMFQQWSAKRIQISNAREKFEYVFREFLKMEEEQRGISHPFRWLPEYVKVCEWLQDNHGKGLFCMGQCGRGKSIICKYVIPVIINDSLHLSASIFNAIDMNNKNNQILISDAKILCVDDLGREELRQEYGHKRIVFSDIMNEVEYKNKLIFVTTNLNPTEIEERYDARTMSRIKAFTKSVTFQGEDLRG